MAWMLTKGKPDEIIKIGDIVVKLWRNSKGREVVEITAPRRVRIRRVKKPEGKQ